MSKLLTVAALGVVGLALLAGSTWASDDDLIKSAMSAAPASVSADATIMDWNFKVLRKGTNGWTCLPDTPDTEGIDPMCVDDAWMNFLKAYIKKEPPTYSSIGIAYMLVDDASGSNSDPFATEPTGPDDWIVHPGPHLMILVPDKAMLKNIPTNFKNGGPWVMWADTPYAHIMIPITSQKY